MQFLMFFCYFISYGQLKRFLTNYFKIKNLCADFSKEIYFRYWLVWENIKGVVRQVYRRLTTYNVQFIAMQVNLL